MQLHDQLRSLDRYVQMTRCFSAVAELIVNYYQTGVYRDCPNFLSAIVKFSQFCTFFSFIELFLPRDALVHSAVMRLLSSVRLSVCLSVCDDQVP